MTDKDELEKLRKKKKEQLKEKAQEEQQDQDTDEERSIDAELRQFMTSDARQRLKTAELANPDLVKTIKEQLVKAHRMGRISERIDEEKIRGILSSANEKTSQSFDIKRR